MISTDMRTYNYYLLGAYDDYGQSQPVGNEPAGAIRIAIYTSSQAIQDNINYKDATYIGLTMATVDDTYIIEYENTKLKVLYVNPKGRYKQVFLKEI